MFAYCLFGWVGYFSAAFLLIVLVWRFICKRLLFGCSLVDFSCCLLCLLVVCNCVCLYLCLLLVFVVLWSFVWIRFGDFAVYLIVLVVDGGGWV